MKGITVIICCYSSASRLPETLKHLALQKTSGILWEVIVVDNASADNTSLIAAEEWSKYNIRDVKFNIINEATPGLSFARQTGVNNAKYEYIIFCDDDNWLNVDYLQIAYNLIDADNTIGAIGGFSTAISDTTFPNWFYEYEASYSFGKQGPATGDISNRGYVCGAGMVTRKTLFKHTINSRYPSILSDRTGSALSTGGDHEYCQRLILQGYILYYSEDLIFKHFMPAYRLTEDYKKRLFKGVDEAEGIIGEYKEAVRIKKLSKEEKKRFCKMAIKDFVKSFLKRRALRPESYKCLFYFLNIGSNKRNDLKIIKHFYKTTKVKSF